MRDGAERTEKATPQKREEARKKGNVMRSAELDSALALLIGIYLIKGMAPWLIDSLKNFMAEFFRFPLYPLTVENMLPLFLKILMNFLMMAFPLTLSLMVVGFVSNALQTGFIFSTESLDPNWNKINPIAGFSNLISGKSLAELVKSLIKLLIIGTMVYHQLSKTFVSFQSLPFMSISAIAARFGTEIFRLSTRIALCLLFLSVLDYAYQRWAYERRLRMTKEEVKEETKQTEGTPHIKAKLRGMQREFSLRLRSIEGTKKADVVIVNPHQIAVALAYNLMEAGAPKVVAKGKHYLAQRMKAVARQHNIPIVENRPLAHLLHERVNLGQEIPATFYRAVAEVLAYVYAKNKT